MRIEWKSNLHGVARFPADYKLLDEGEPAGTFEAYVAVFSTPDRPDLFGDSDIIEPGAFTQTLQEKGLPSFSERACSAPNGSRIRGIAEEDVAEQPLGAAVKAGGLGNRAARLGKTPVVDTAVHALTSLMAIAVSGGRATAFRTTSSTT